MLTAGKGNACSSRGDSIFLSFLHSKQLQSQKNAIYFLDLAAEQRIKSPLLFSFDCGRSSSSVVGSDRWQILMFDALRRVEHLIIRSAVHSQFDARSPYVSQPPLLVFSVLPNHLVRPV
jgi:hypothetical protein